MSSPGSQELIRDMNSHLVLEAIINQGPISRADLAKALGLTKATISSIVQNLIDNDLVKEIGSQDTTKGRKPILLCFKASGGSIISIDLSVDSVTILLSDLMGGSCILKQYDYPARYNALLDSLVDMIHEIKREAPDSVYGIVGICIGIHGIVHQNQIVFTPYYHLSDMDIAQTISRMFGVPVYIENEANLSALGEKHFYYDFPNLINISIHSGIGLGIIIDGKLYAGQNGYAGEFGHTIVMPEGRKCPCGNQGCIEQYASQRAIVNDYRQLSGQPNATAQMLIDAYLQNDEKAVQCIHSFIRYISIGINNLLNTFNPDIIIINSLFTMNIPDLSSRITQNLHNRMKHSCRLVPSVLQDTAILLGGVYVCAKNFLEIDDLILKKTF